MGPAPSGTPAPRRADTAAATVFVVGRLVEEAGWWLLLISGIGYGVNAGARPEHIGLLLAAWLLPRLPVLVAVRLAHPVLAYGALLAILVVIGALNRAGVVEGFALILLLVGLLGAARALRVAQRTAGIAGGVSHHFAGADATRGLVGWLGLAMGAVLASGVALLPTAADWALWTATIGIGMLAVGATAARAVLIGVCDNGMSARRSRGAPGGPSVNASGAGFRALVRSRVATHIAVGVATGAMWVTVIALLPFRATAVAGDHRLFGAGLVLVALGGVTGYARPPREALARMRQRLPPVLVVAGLVWALAAAVALLALADWWLAAVLSLAIGGVVLALLQHEQVIRVRHLDAGRSSLGTFVAAGVVGQVMGAITVAALGPEPAAIGGPLVVMAIGAVVLMAVALLTDRASIFALRHQVQQFSWNARPEPRPYEPAPAGTRQARLEAWTSQQVELELVDVTLPVSGRRYAIARPSGDGRDRLFEEAKADPERQMPYWAKVWPSGVALADVVVERADEIRGRQVLELGAGLGVTACAVLEEDGRLTTADYSLLPLGLCRLNGLANAGRTPGSTCFNWRDEQQVREVLRRHPPIGLILAADVLYEGRDVMPLVRVIERLLAPGGSLWLAEPVRRTAHRFLDTVAATGWSIESRRIRAEWPDATDGWVNVHIIQREREPTEAAIGLGAFQL